MVGARDLDPFFQSVLKLKSVRRAGWVSKVKVQSPESVADHTFAACAVAMVFADMLALDTGRVMRMVVLHDLAESVIGDYMPGDVSRPEKLLKEKKAMRSILKCLPAALRSDYEEIWQEYLDNKTKVSRFVHRIDKLEMAMQANEYSKRGYDRKLISPFFDSARKALGNEGDIIDKTFTRFSSTQV